MDNNNFVPHSHNYSQISISTDTTSQNIPSNSCSSKEESADWILSASPESMLPVEVEINEIEQELDTQLPPLQTKPTKVRFNSQPTFYSPAPGTSDYNSSMSTDSPLFAHIEEKKILIPPPSEELDNAMGDYHSLPPLPPSVNQTYISSDTHHDEEAYEAPLSGTSKPRVSFPNILSSAKNLFRKSNEDSRKSTSDPSTSLLSDKFMKGAKFWGKEKGEDGDSDDDSDDFDAEDENDPAPSRKFHALWVSIVLFVTTTLAFLAMVLPFWFYYTGSYFDNGAYTKFSEKAGLYLGCTSYTYYKTLPDLLHDVNPVSSNSTCRDLLFISCSALISDSKIDVVDVLKLNSTQAGSVVKSGSGSGGFVLEADIKITNNSVAMLPISERVLEQSAKIPCRQNKAAFALALVGAIFAYVGVGAQISNTRSDERIQLKHFVTLLATATLTIIEIIVFYLTVKSQWDFQSLGRDTLLLGPSFFMWTFSLFINFIMSVLLVLLHPANETPFIPIRERMKRKREAEKSERERLGLGGGRKRKGEKWFGK